MSDQARLQRLMRLSSVKLLEVLMRSSNKSLTHGKQLAKAYERYNCKLKPWYCLCLLRGLGNEAGDTPMYRMVIKSLIVVSPRAPCQQGHSHQGTGPSRCQVQMVWYRRLFGPLHHPAECWPLYVQQHRAVRRAAV